MKFAQFYEDSGKVRVGIVAEDLLLPLDFEGDLVDFMSQAPESYPFEQGIPLSEARLAPVITRPSKIIALGLNYKDHARESKGEPPREPLIFAKFSNSLTAHGSPIQWSTRLTQKVDFEAELCVIIGKSVKDLDENQALEAVFGYTCANDVSARDLQFGDGQWVRGKSLDTFCPAGPWVVTRDELGDGSGLAIRCRLNGELMQDSNTSQMIFSVPKIVSFLSRHFSLFPGDIILTGTPSGVGAFRQPPVYLKDGDVVEVEIHGIGTLTNPCKVLT